MLGLFDIPSQKKLISDVTVKAMFPELYYMFCYKDHANVFRRADGKTMEDHEWKRHKIRNVKIFIIIIIKMYAFGRNI